MDNIKEAGELSDIGLAGLQVRTTIRSFNFAALSDAGATPENLRRLGLRVPAEVEVDEVIWYIESGLIQALVDFEITSQDFVNQSVVIVNGTRIEVSLADQG